jgi:hypothetical protein
MTTQAEQLRPNVVLHSHGDGVPQLQRRDHSVALSRSRGLLSAPGLSARAVLMPSRTLEALRVDAGADGGTTARVGSRGGLMSRLAPVHADGQSVWADFLRRSLIAVGRLQRLIREDTVTGLTSNPTIFRRAIAGSSDYDEAIRALRRRGRRVARVTLTGLEVAIAESSRGIPVARGGCR